MDNVTRRRLRSAVAAYGGVREFSRLTGVPYSTVWDHLHGVSNPSPAVVARYANLLPEEAGMAGWNAVDVGTPEAAAFVARNLPPEAAVTLRAYGRTYPADRSNRWKTYFPGVRPSGFGRDVQRYVKSYDRAMDLRWQVVWRLD